MKRFIATVDFIICLYTHWLLRMQLLGRHALASFELKTFADYMFETNIFLKYVQHILNIWIPQMFNHHMFWANKYMSNIFFKHMFIFPTYFNMLQKIHVFNVSSTYVNNLFLIHKLNICCNITCIKREEYVVLKKVIFFHFLMLNRIYQVCFI